MDISGDRLKDKVVIVTGAGASGDDEFVGIGQAIAVLMAAQGASVLLVDMDEANAVKTVSQIHELEGIGSIFIGDVTDSLSCNNMANAALERYGKIDVLVNNVGMLKRTSGTKLLT